MRLDQFLEEKRREILRIAAKHGAREVRVFGSAARGAADQESDVDFLVELEAGRSLLDLGGLQMELGSLLGRRIDVVTLRGLKARIRTRSTGSTRVRVPKERVLDILEAIAAIERHCGRLLVT
jgi:predicted nucleotidyltransferase